MTAANTAPLAHRRAPREESWARRHLVWMLVALAYVAVAPYFPRINNPNENVRIWMTRAIAVDHTLAIDHVSAKWGYVDDKATANGHLYSSKAPGTSLLGVPVLWLQTQLWRAFGWPAPTKRATTFALRYLTVVPCAVLFLLAFGRWVERRTGSPAARDLLTVGLGLGTLLYPYGILFVGHAQAAFAAFGAFMALTWPRVERAAEKDSEQSAEKDAERDAKKGAAKGASEIASASASFRSHARLAAAGALAAAAVVFEYQLVLVALVLAGFAAWRFRARALWFVVGALPIALLLGTYHTALFGRPWAFPYGHLENQTYARQHHSAGFFGLQAPHLDALGTSLFSVAYGLFVFSPFLLAGAIVAVRRALRRPRAEAVVILAGSGALLLFLAGMTHWRAGWCVGPRYIAGCVPFLAAGVALDWRLFDGGGRRAAWLRGGLVGLIAVSMFLNGISAATYPHYPEQFDNPVFDLAMPLWRDGYVPGGLGHALALPSLWALVPIAALWAAALSVAIASELRSARAALTEVAIATLVAACVLVPLAAYGNKPSSIEEHATAVVRSLWDPPATNR